MLSVSERVQLILKTPTGKETRLTVNPSLDRIPNEKQEIHPDKQRALFAGLELQDDKTLQDCSITHCSTLRLVRLSENSICLNVKTLKRKEVRFVVSPTEMDSLQMLTILPFVSFLKHTRNSTMTELFKIIHWIMTRQFLLSLPMSTISVSL